MSAAPTPPGGVGADSDPVESAHASQPLPWETPDQPIDPNTQVVYLISVDGATISLPPELLELSTTCKNLLRSPSKPFSFQNSLGGIFSVEDNRVILKKEERVLATLLQASPQRAEILLQDVKGATLRKVLEYCWYDIQPEDKYPERDRKAWRHNFVNVEQSQLCDLASASYYLDIKSLVNLTSRAIASQVSGKTTEELRETLYSIGADLYSPVGSTRQRLQKKMIQKKQNPEKKQTITGSADNRSLDELLQFIERDNRSSKSNAKSQMQVQQKNPPTVASTGKTQGPANSNSNSIDRSSDPKKSSQSKASSGADPTLQEALRRLEEVDPYDDAFWTAEEDRELGPAAREALDREVEMFRQRLEADINSPAPASKIRIPMKPAEFMKKMNFVDVC